MFIAPAGTLLITILLVILAGSLLGSVIAFATRGSATDKTPVPVYTRPGQMGRRDIPVYRVSRPSGQARRRKGGWLLVPVFALAYVVSTGALFSWQSAWPVATDLRHLATAPHCSLARALNLGNAAKGTPGYFTWHDPDGNGIACEDVPQAPIQQTAALPIAPVNRLSATPLVWPAGRTAQGNSPAEN